MTDLDVAAALRARLSVADSAPLVTYVGADGSRTELSTRTFENNAAKAANLLRDDADVSPDSVVALALPPHWQASVWLGACGLVGCVAWLGGDTADSAVEVAVLGPDTLTSPLAPITLASTLHPFGLPWTAELPRGVLDLALEVRAHGDRFVPERGSRANARWLRVGDRTWTQAEALDEARDLADELALPASGRLLCALPLEPRSALAILALPLATGGSVVLVDPAHPDLDAVATSERADVVLR